MCLLVVNTFPDVVDEADLRLVSARIVSLIKQARQDALPVVHLHQKSVPPGASLRIPIGRYDPVFRSDVVGLHLPDGLIDLIVARPTRVIHLVGAAMPDQMDRLRGLLEGVGHATRMDLGAIVPRRQGQRFAS